MECLFTSIVLLLCFSLCVSLNHWNDFKVINPRSLMRPISLPRSMSDAILMGWDIQDIECEGNKGYVGYAWSDKANRDTFGLLFDDNNYIAGMQAFITEAEAARIGIPSSRQVPPITKHPNRHVYAITLYFVDPSKICNGGRTEIEFESQGTGTNLYLQYGDKVMNIDRMERDVQLPWVEGKCHFTLGRFYWYDIYEDMSLDALFPVFPIYNGGDLNGFGIIYPGQLQSTIYAHLSGFSMNKMVREVPRSFANATFSLYYVFFTDNLWLNFC